MVVGEGEEVLDGLGGGFTEAEGVVDLLEGDGHCGEALVLSVEEEGLGGGEELLGGDEDPVGLVRGVSERGEARRGGSWGGGRPGGDGEVAVTLLGGEDERAVPGAPEDSGAPVRRGRGGRSRGEARGFDEAVLEGLALEGAPDGGEGVRVLEGEAVEVDGGGGLAEALEAEGVRALDEDALGDVGVEGEGRRGRPRGPPGEEVPSRETRTWWSCGRWCRCRPGGRTRILAAPGAGAAREKAKSRPGAGEEARPDPQVRGVEESGEVVEVLLDGGGGEERGQGRRGAERGGAAAGGDAEGHAQAAGGDGELEDGVLGVGGVEPSERKKSVEPGPKRSGRGSTWKGTATPRRERRRVEVSSMRFEEARSGEPPEGVAARRSSQATAWRPLERETKRARSRSSREGWRPQADGCGRWSPDAGLSGDDTVEDDGDEEPSGEDEATAGGVEAQGSELDVGLLGVALEGGLEDAGLGAGVEAAGERSGGHGAEAGLVGAVAQRDGLGGAGARGQEAVEARAGPRP